MSERVPASDYSALEHAAIADAEQRAASHDKQLLRALGVVHTPLELVRFALRRVERAVREELREPDGLAGQLTVLDPAVGTGVWLASLLSRLGHARSSLLAFERDEQATQRVRALLEPEANRRGVTLAVRCENTLEVENPWLDDRPRVVIGNPPWGARSLSRGGALSDAWLREFHHDAQGEPLKERRSGVLSDDYVRFFRWALEQARTAPQGAIVCFVSNGSYLEGPIHRGMRGALVHAFDRIELLDLGGSTLLSGTGARDEGLFPVRVGAVLALCVRRPGSYARHASLDYTRLTGDRASKLAALCADTFAAQTFSPQAPSYRFRPASSAPAREVDGFSIAQAFPFHGEGVQTNRDQLVTASTRALLLEQLQRIVTGELTLLDSGHLDAAQARARLREALASGPDIGELAYRPFEKRFFCRLAPLCHRPRPLLARAMNASSLCLLSARKELGGSAWNMFGSASMLADSSFLSTRSSCRTRLFPSHGPDGAPNLGEAVAKEIAAQIGRSFEPGELIAYVVGVLGSTRFRAVHDAQLKHDYARIPWPRTHAAFERAMQVGRIFIELLEGTDRSSTSSPVVTLEAPDGELARERTVQRKQLRWVAPHILELGKGAQIGVGQGASMSARVGHHAIVSLAFGPRDETTIRELMRACRRAAMWDDAEKQADNAYQSVCSV